MSLLNACGGCCSACNPPIFIHHAPCLQLVASDLPRVDSSVEGLVGGSTNCRVAGSKALVVTRDSACMTVLSSSPARQQARPALAEQRHCKHVIAHAVCKCAPQALKFLLETLPWLVRAAGRQAGGLTCDLIPRDGRQAGHSQRTHKAGELQQKDVERGLLRAGEERSRGRRGQGQGSVPAGLPAPCARPRPAVSCSCQQHPPGAS